jgi:hypothetical protein
MIRHYVRCCTVCSQTRKAKFACDIYIHRICPKKKYIHRAHNKRNGPLVCGGLLRDSKDVSYYQRLQCNLGRNNPQHIEMWCLVHIVHISRNF